MAALLTYNLGEKRKGDGRKEKGTRAVMSEGAYVHTIQKKRSGYVTDSVSIIKPHGSFSTANIQQPQSSPPLSSNFNGSISIFSRYGSTDTNLVSHKSPTLHPPSFVTAAQCINCTCRLHRSH